MTEDATHLQNQHRIGQSATGQLETPQKSQSLTGQFTLAPSRPFTLSWTHYVFLLGIKNPDERSFYEIEATEQVWTVRELKRQFDSSLYERLQEIENPELASQRSSKKPLLPRSPVTPMLGAFPRTSRRRLRDAQKDDKL